MRKTLPILGILVAILLFAGSFALNKNTVLAPITIAINPWPGYEFLYLAERLGYLWQDDTRVTLKQFSSLEDVHLAYERNQIDGMCVTIVEVLQTYNNTGRHAQAVLIPDYSSGADMIIAAAPITSVKELKGKKVGVEPMTLGSYVLSRALEKAGLNDRDVTVLGYPQLDMSRALSTGEINAAVTYVPIALNIHRPPDTNIIFTSKEIPGELIDVIAVDENILQDNPALAPLLKKAWTKALLYAQKNPADAYAIMGGREGISTAEFKNALTGIEVLNVFDQETLIENGTFEKSIENIANVLYKTGRINKPIHDPRLFVYLPLLKE